MAGVTIWHNPRCSKSRATLALLEERGIEPSVRLYLEAPPSATEVLTLKTLLGASSVRDLMRPGESEYAEQALGADGLDDDALAAAVAATPKLLQRPIVVAGDAARIGRPPEDVLEIL